MTQPTCSCGDPATTQQHIATTPGRNRTNATRHYAWRCEPCAREADIEREISRAT